MDIRQVKQLERVLIYGYGREGVSTHNFLTSHFADVEVVVYDDVQSEYNNPAVLEYDYDVVVVSPGVDRTELKLTDRELVLTSQVELFFGLLTESDRKKVVGVTGSKGKSTTAEYIYLVLREAGKSVEKAGNMGLPVLDYVNSLDGDVLTDLDCLVLELSSYQLEFLRRSPHYALFTSFYSMHDDRHGGAGEYFDAKQNLWLHQSEADYLFVPQVAFEQQRFQGCLANINSNLVVSEQASADMFASDSVLQAEHFRHNFGAALELFKILKIEPIIVKKVGKEFKGIEHRLEHVRDFDGKRFINDSIAVAPAATLAAINYVQTTDFPTVSIILGGKDSNLDNSELLKKLVEENIHSTLLGDQMATEWKRLFDEQGYSMYAQVKTLEQAVEVATEECPRGGTVLLSTGSQSFDMFKNFEDRGVQFKNIVNNLK